jgi:hypothetical protein
MRTYRNLTHGRFIFESWSGALFKFPPDGGMARQVLEKRLSFEFDEVVHGRAR